MLGLYEERYAGFTVKHFHYRWDRSGTITRQARLHGDPAGVAKGRGWCGRRRGARRISKKRPRRPMVGMMLHQDASRFAWLPGDDRQSDPAVTLDDATSAVYSGFIVAEEGTASSFSRAGRGDLPILRGLFCELYTDRGSHYFHTPKAGEPVSKSVETQVGRALAQLGRLTTSCPIRPDARRAGVPSAPSAPCRTGCRRSWRWPASRRSRRPIAGSPRLIGRPIMPPSRCPGPRPAARSSPTAPAGCATSCASRRSDGWATTAPSSGAA